MIPQLLRYYLRTRYWKNAPYEKLRAMQLARFKKLFEHAREHSAFYARLYTDAGVRNLDIQAWSDVEKIPIINKRTMRGIPYEELITVPITDKLNLHTTSGSTGEPFRVYQNKYEDYTAHVRVFSLLRDIGYHPWKKITMITRYESGDRFEVEQDLSMIAKLQKAIGVFQRNIISVYTPPAEIIRQVEEDPPYILWSTPSVLDMVATELQRQGKSWNIPRVVLTSENVLPHQYERFYERISKTVISHYGLMECTTVSYDINASGRRRVFAYSTLMENIDRHNDNGKMVGTPVVTNLENYTMPFIRYNTEDIGTVLDHPEFPNRVMGPVLGRLDDVLDFPDGSKFVHHHAYSMFTDFEACAHYKFIQHGNGPIVLQIKPQPNRPKEEIEREARDRWNHRFPGYYIEIEFVDSFEIHPKTGKFKNIEKFD